MRKEGRDRVVGINVIGMRRAGLSTAQITAVRQAFRVLYRQGMVIPAALQRIQAEWGHIDVVAELVAFVQSSARGINPFRDRRTGLAA